MSDYPIGLEMSGKIEMFPHGGGFLSGPEDYQDWARALADESWVTICQRYDRDYQCAILRAITVTGIPCKNWTWYFYKVVHSLEMFQDFDKEFQRGTLSPDWTWFAYRIPNSLAACAAIFMPCPVPEWLWAYNYTQSQYLDDLARFWHNVDPLYYRPWPGAQSNPIAHDIAKIHLAGKEARWEIDETARHYRNRQSTYR